MKNKMLKMTFALVLSNCLLFTACGAEETVASIEESTTESTVESTTDVVEESVAEVENDIESDVVESEVTNEVETESTDSVNSTSDNYEFQEGEYSGDDEVVPEGPRGEDHQTTYDANGDGVLDQADNAMVNSIVDKLLEKYGNYTGSGSGSTSGSGASSGGAEVDHSKDFGDKGFSGLVPSADTTDPNEPSKAGTGDYTGLDRYDTY